MNRKQLLWAFIQLMGFGAMLFVLSVFLAKPITDLIKYMNVIDATRPAVEWAAFTVTVLFYGSLWCASWVGFKRAEKACIRYFDN